MNSVQGVRASPSLIRRPLVFYSEIEDLSDTSIYFLTYTFTTPITERKLSNRVTVSECMRLPGFEDKDNKKRYSGVMWRDRCRIRITHGVWLIDKPWILVRSTFPESRWNARPTSELFRSYAQGEGSSSVLYRVTHRDSVPWPILRPRYFILRSPLSPKPGFSLQTTSVHGLFFPGRYKDDFG